MCVCACVRACVCVSVFIHYEQQCRAQRCFNSGNNPELKLYCKYCITHWRCKVQITNTHTGDFNEKSSSWTRTQKFSPPLLYFSTGAVARYPCPPCPLSTLNDWQALKHKALMLPTTALFNYESGWPYGQTHCIFSHIQPWTRTQQTHTHAYTHTSAHTHTHTHTHTYTTEEVIYSYSTLQDKSHEFECLMSHQMISTQEHTLWVCVSH